MDFRGPEFNSPPPKSSAGDALGMGAISERLYGDVFPGINNVVHYVRVYSALCWVVSQTYRQVGIEQPTLARAKHQSMALEKMQLLLMWHAAQTPTIDRIPGKKNLASKSQLNIANPGAGKLRLLDATWYQPSITNGLGLLRRLTVRKKTVYECLEAGEKLAEAFEALVSEKLTPALRNWLLDTSPGALVCDEERLEELLPALSLEERPTQDEIDAFLQVFMSFERTPGLIQAMHTADILKKNKLSAKVDDIRVAMAAGVAPNGATIALDSCRQAQLSWSVLQVRLLQRLAAETLLALVERYLRIAAAGHDLDTTKSGVAQAIANCVHMTADGESSNFGATFLETAAVLKVRQGNKPTLQSSGIQTQDALISLQSFKSNLRSKIPNEVLTWRDRGQLAIWAMAYCAVEAGNLARLHPGVKELLLEDEDKFSLAQLQELANICGELPLREFTQQLVLQYIIDLHLTTAISRTAQAARKGLSANRFLFQPVEGRLEWWNDGRGRAPLQVGEAGDVLYAAMRLLADCALLDYVPVETLGAARFATSFSLTKAGKQWLAANTDTRPTAKW